MEHLDPNSRMQNTIVCGELDEFVEVALQLGHCFRCLSPVDPGYDDWATLAQAGTKVGEKYLIGGIICAPCVESWGQWLRGGEQSSAGG